MKPHVFLFVVLLLGSVTAVQAASECADEQLTHCGHVVGQDKHLIAACLTEHMTSFTPRCREVTRTIVQNINETEFCRHDFYEFCGYDGPIPPAAQDIERIFSCLIENYDQFTPACRGYLDKNVKEMKE